MGYSPKAITALYPLLEAQFSSAARSGVYTDKAGYHGSRNDHLRSRRDDYSIQLDIDQLGDPDAGSAIDVKMNRAHLRTVTERMLAASKAKDPRLQGKIREWFGSLDGDGVEGWSLYRSRFATSDDSHEWHLHISGYRKWANDSFVWLGVAEVLLGLKPGTLAKRTYLPVYLVDPAKISTTLIANAPAGKEDLERKPLFRITTGEKIVLEDGKRWLVTAADYSYALDFLVLESEFKARPKPEPVKPAPVQTEPVPAPPRPVPAPNPIPPPPPKPAPAFDAELVLELDAPGSGNWQGAMRTRDNWYLAEARKQDDGSEDCSLYRFDAAGKYLDSMRLNADVGLKVHPTGWGMSDGDVGWVTWNDKDDFDLVTFRYQPGEVIPKSQTQIMVVGPGNIQIAFDDSRNLASLRRVRADWDEHALVTKDSILDGKPARVDGTKLVRIPRKATRVVQGFTVALGHLYVLTGLHSANSPFTLEKWSFATGKLVETRPIPVELGDEPEGIDASDDYGNVALLFGMKTAKGTARRLKIYRTRL